MIVGNYAIGIGGDFITAVEGKPVEAQDAIQRAMTRKRVGEQLELTINRAGKTQKIMVRLGESKRGSIAAHWPRPFSRINCFAPDS